MPDDALRILATVTPRDRQLLRWLVDHRVLTTPQITAALFNSPITASHRLARLRRRGLTDRFRWHPGGGGSTCHHHVIGPLGARLVAAERGQPVPRPQRLRDQRTSLAANPQLAHILGANDFFIQLLAHARHQPGTKLHAWLNTSQAVREHAVFNDAGIRPDAYGEWQQHGRTVCFFLEHDTGTERPLTRLTDKIDAYQRAVRSGWPHHPVLIWLHSQRRETHLHAILSSRPPPAMPVATAARGHTTSVNPADAIWAQPHRPGPRQRLIDLNPDTGVEEDRNRIER